MSSTCPKCPSCDSDGVYYENRIHWECGAYAVAASFQKYGADALCDWGGACELIASLRAELQRTEEARQVIVTAYENLTSDRDDEVCPRVQCQTTVRQLRAVSNAMTVAHKEAEKHVARLIAERDELRAELDAMRPVVTASEAWTSMCSGMCGDGGCKYCTNLDAAVKEYRNAHTIRGERSHDTEAEHE